METIPFNSITQKEINKMNDYLEGINYEDLKVDNSHLVLDELLVELDTFMDSISSKEEAYCYACACKDEITQYYYGVSSINSVISMIDSMKNECSPVNKKRVVTSAGFDR